MKRVSTWQSVMRTSPVRVPPSSRWPRPAVPAGPAEFLGAPYRADEWIRRLRSKIDERYVRWCADYCLHLARTRVT